MSTWRVRFPGADDKTRAKSISTLASNAAVLQPRQFKSRRGCKQCKQRKIKCDECEPVCKRCAARGLSCSGSDPRLPWNALTTRRHTQAVDLSMPPSSSLHGELVQYWFSNACSIMTLSHPESNPISNQITWMLTDSKALLYSIQSLSHAHRNFFSQNALAPALEHRQKALLSLRYELSNSDFPEPTGPSLEILLLTILLLGISAGWFDLDSHDFGQDHLHGAEASIKLLLQAETNPSQFSTYLIGVYIYWNMCCSFLGGQGEGLERDERLWNITQRMRESAAAHPMTGVATDLMLIMTRVGRYCHQAFVTRIRDSEQEHELRTILLDWFPPEASHEQDLKMIAEAYRLTGLVMLRQLPQSPTEPDSFQTFKAGDISQEVLLAMRVIAILLDIPLDSPRISVSGWLLTIVAGEIPATMPEMRELVRGRFRNLYTTLRLGVTLRGLDLVEECWVRHDQGAATSWLEVMNDQGWALMMG